MSFEQDLVIHDWWWLGNSGKYNRLKDCDMCSGLHSRHGNLRQSQLARTGACRRAQVIWMINVLLSIITCYCTLLHTWGFQLDFIAERDVGALDVYRLELAIYLDRHSEEKLQPTVPDVVWAQDKPFYPGRASEDKVFSVVSELLARERPGQHCDLWCPLWIVCPICNIP